MAIFASFAHYLPILHMPHTPVATPLIAAVRHSLACGDLLFVGPCLAKHVQHAINRLWRARDDRFSCIFENLAELLFTA